MRIGTSASLISTGVFFRKAELAPEPSVPSPQGMPPEPPVMGSIEATTRRPVRLSMALTFMIGPPLAGLAGNRSGAAWTKAPKIIACRRCTDRVRSPTAAGKSGLTILPEGRMQRQIRAMPAFRNSRVSRE